MPIDTGASSPYRKQLLEAAKQFGTPSYVYFEAIINRQSDRLRKLFDGLPTKLLYAMKANSNPAVLRTMHRQGFGLEVVSEGELALALRLGFSPDSILFSANNMTDDEMHFAKKSGVLLNIGELSRLDRYGRAFPGSEVSVRLNPQVGAGHHEHVITAGARSKFGIPVEEASEVRRVLAKHNLRLAGLHQHIGSGILETSDFARAIRVLLDAAPSFPDIRFLNFGGGLGVPYRPDEENLDLESFRTAILPMLHDFRTGRFSDVEYRFEPGRFLTAEAGVLVVEVNTIKDASGRVFAGTNSGMGHLVRPTVYGAYHAISNLSNPDGTHHTYDVAGNICESGDLFARDREVPEIREGDILGVMDAGAYGMAMASTYNLRPLPAEVFVAVDGSMELVRRRVTADELAAQYLAESGVLS